jgi:hypothetical protein
MKTTHLKVLRRNVRNALSILSNPCHFSNRHHRQSKSAFLNHLKRVLQVETTTLTALFLPPLQVSSKYFSCKAICWMSVSLNTGRSCTACPSSGTKNEAKRPAMLVDVDNKKKGGILTMVSCTRYWRFLLRRLQIQGRRRRCPKGRQILPCNHVARRRSCISILCVTLCLRCPVIYGAHYWH